MGNIRMVVLTKSSKYGNSCVAGINLYNGNWVRLVTNDERSHGAVSNDDLICKNGKIVRILDVIDVPIIGFCGDLIQPENVLLDVSTYIEISGKMSLSDVLRIHPLESQENILGNKYAYITDQRVANVGHSLTIVKVNDLEIVHGVNSSGEAKTKANFYYNGDRYENMSVTDRDFYSVMNGSKFNEAIIVVSIGTPYNNKYYKFVSAIYI